METISLLMDEHKNIQRVLKVSRKLCLKILYDGEVDYEAFDVIIDFLKNYADRHHHSEEDILLRKMEDELDETDQIEKMFAEHDLAKVFVANLEQALERVKEGEEDSKLDVIANAVAYADLLNRHIEKENNIIYKYAETNLSQEALDEVERKVREIEKVAGEKKITSKYTKILDNLEVRTAF